MSDLIAKLAEPFPVNRIHWRIGQASSKGTALALAYLDARDVMKRLDDVVGPLNWNNRYSHICDGVAVCEIGINVSDEWIWKANGAGDTQVEKEKGKLSDAFKRAAVMWGIGRYLYSLPAVWVPFEERGKFKYLPDDSIAQLRQRMPAWATPEGYAEILEKRKAA